MPEKLRLAAIVEAFTHCRPGNSGFPIMKSPYGGHQAVLVPLADWRRIGEAANYSWSDFGERPYLIHWVLEGPTLRDAKFDGERP